MTQEEFKILRDLINRKSGIFLADSKKDLLVNRLARRLRSLKIDSPSNYLKLLDEDKSGEEILNLIDVVSTNVTAFFRESTHYDYLQQLAFGQFNLKAGKVKIWCAGSSTGEEAYSAAIALLESGVEAKRIKVVGSDISCSALKKAEQGVYSEKCLEKMNETLIRRYFHFDKDSKQYRVIDELKELVEFRQSNLAQVPCDINEGPYDVIFCRNVMIYFRPDLRKTLINEFYRQLVDLGHLFVGHSECLLDYKNLFDFIGPNIYQKR